MTMKTLASGVSVVGLAAAISFPAMAFPADQNAGPPPAATLTPSAIALLAGTMDSAALESAARAITSGDPLARTVAARLLGVAGYAASADRIAAAFEGEQDPAAAVEQARALLFFRGAAAGQLIEPRLRASAHLAMLYADWIVRHQPERLAGLLPTLSSSLTGDGRALTPYAFAALDKQPDGGEQLLRAALASSTPSAWRGLIDRIQFGARPRQTVVLIEALAVQNPAIREATVWSLATNLAQGRQVPAALLDAATAGAGTASAGPDDGAPTWEQFGRELLARQHHGQATPDRSVLITAEAARHRANAQELWGMKQLLEPERKALRAVLGDALPRRRSGQVPATGGERSGIAMRTLPALWPGLLKAVLDTANCKPRGNLAIALMSVTYMADGRAGRVLINNNPLPSGCVTAALALARLALADTEYPPPANATEWLVLPLDDDYIACATAPGTLSAERPVTIGADSIQPPRRTRDVQPVYPASLRSAGIQGAVIMESEISSTGCVTNLRVMHSPELLFSFSAVRAVSSWRFTPTRVDNREVPVSMTVTVDFTMR